MKELMQIKGLGRYNDDGYMIHEDKEHLKKCLKKMEELCEKLGLTISRNKTHIMKVKNFTFLKVKFTMTESGKIVKRLSRQNVTRHRRKIKRLTARMKSGKITKEDLIVSQKSWKGHAKKLKSYNTIKNMDKLVNELIKESEVK